MNMDSYPFPLQKVLIDNKPFSKDLLLDLLEMVYDAPLPFTGYILFAGDDSPLYFLFFFNGSPYAAGRYTEGKPISCSIRELGGHLVRTSTKPMTVAVCETDPVLLKSMLLFMQEEADVKAPTTLLDCEHIVRQISEAGKNAMIAMCRDNKINFFFFREGKGALAYYADPSFERPEEMTVDEEMLLYAYQPGEKVQAYIFRDMIATMADDLNLLDKKTLYQLLTVGYLENRRRVDAEAPPVQEKKTEPVEETEMLSQKALDGIEVLVRALRNEPKLLNAVLFVESGEHKGEHFTVALPCTIGRKNCDLILADRLVSRRHAELKMVDNRLLIEDLASTNGTKVNGKKVTREWLAPNDLISIGPNSLRIFPS